METIVDKLEDMHDLTEKDMRGIWKLFGNVLEEILDIVKKDTKVRKCDNKLGNQLNVHAVNSLGQS